MKLLEYLRRPKPFAPSTMAFWDDPYIASNMRSCHLDPHQEAASRKPETIRQSVQFIKSVAPPTQFPSLLDLGCGPGLYADLFEQNGYTVTGIDLSKGSLQYARSTNPGVTYHQANYLTLDSVDTYDIIVMIYCDFAVLKPTDRADLLGRIYRALKLGGVFMLDAFTEAYVKKLPSYQSWSHVDTKGFFKAIPHLLFSARYHYDAMVFGEQYVWLCLDGTTETIRVWNQGFTPSTLSALLETANFAIRGVYQDFTGQPYDEAADTFMIHAVKHEPLNKGD